MLCHLSFLTIAEDESAEEEEEVITEDMAKEALWDSLSPFGVVRQLSFVKRTKKSLSVEVTMDKSSESLRSAIGMNGVSLPLTRLTSSLVRTQFLGVKTTKLLVTFPSAVPDNAQAMLRRRFSCCGQLLHVDKPPPTPAAGEELQEQYHAMQITFDSNLSALRAVEDFSERGVLNLLPVDVKLAFQEEEEAQQQQPKRVQQTAATKRARTPMVEVAKRKPSVDDGEEEGLKRTKSEPTVMLREADEEEEDEVVSRHQLFIVHSKQVTPEELEQVFKLQPGCVQIEIMRTKKKHDLVRGTSFVTFDTAEAAQAAQREWDGMEFPVGCFLKAMFARGQRTSPLSMEKQHNRNEEVESTPTKSVKTETNNKHRDSEPNNADALIDSFGNAMALNSSPVPQSPPAHWTTTPAMQQQQQWMSPSEFQYQQQQPMYAYDYTMPQQYFMPPPSDAMYPLPPSLSHWPYGPPSLSPLPPQQRVMYFVPGMNEQADNSRLYVSYVRPSPGSPSQNGASAVADPITEDHIKQFFSAAAGDLHHVFKVKDRPAFFVKFRTTFSAMQAMLRLNGFNLNGCTLRVVLADPPRIDSRGSHNHPGNKSPGSSANAPESESKRRRDENGGD